MKRCQYHSYSVHLVTVLLSSSIQGFCKGMCLHFQKMLVVTICVNTWSEKFQFFFFCSVENKFKREYIDESHVVLQMFGHAV